MRKKLPGALQSRLSMNAEYSDFIHLEEDEECTSAGGDTGRGGNGGGNFG